MSWETLVFPAAMTHKHANPEVDTYWSANFLEKVARNAMESSKNSTHLQHRWSLASTGIQKRSVGNELVLSDSFNNIKKLRPDFGFE